MYKGIQIVFHTFTLHMNKEIFILIAPIDKSKFLPNISNIIMDLFNKFRNIFKVPFFSYRKPYIYFYMFMIDIVSTPGSSKKG